MPPRDELTPRQVIDIASGDNVANRDDLLREGLAEAAGAHHRLFTDEAWAASHFPAEEFARFEERLGYSFPAQDAWLVRAALTTKAFGAESLGQSTAAQRLAWIGDAKICDVLSEALIAAFPTAAHGELCVARTARINRKTLAGAARAVGIDRMLVLSKSYVGSHGAAARDELSKGMLGEAFEAVLGAVALSGGPEAVRRCYFRSVPLPTTFARLQQETAELMAPDADEN